MSYTKILCTLIINSLTNSCLCTYMINKYKYHLMWFSDQFSLSVEKASLGLDILVMGKKVHK
jgi:hypothetical protein